jgi:hypothetical protein
VRTVSLSIDSLVDKVDRNEIRLPEIQRAYVWKPTQVAGLIDSLYRRYPSGSLLLWETDAVVNERDAAITGPSDDPTVRPQYLLDGQQRLTSLHRVYKNHPQAQVVFNVETERFQIQSAATKKDDRWVTVFDIINGEQGVFALVTRLHERLSQMSPDVIANRLERLKKVSDYTYHIEIIESLPYEEVTDIFVRVNSKGRALGAVDLALATLSARWPGVIQKLDNEAAKWKEEGFKRVDFAFLARALAAIANEGGTLKGFATTPIDELESGWKKVKLGLGHLIPLLRNNLGITTSDLIPSMNALIPPVVHLGIRDDSPMPAAETNGLLYWLFGSFLLGRFSAAADTAIAQDAAALKGGRGLDGLYANLGIRDERLTVTEDALVGRGANSPYFLLSYLAARSQGAKDWWYGAGIAFGEGGGLSIEYHHIHPRATLRADYSKAEINDLSNLAFISGKANRKISSRSPARYFPELLDADPDSLRLHFVPEAEELRDKTTYPEFLRERRALLAEAMTSFLDSLRPSDVTADSPTAADPTTGERLALTIYSPTHDPRDGLLVARVIRDSENWELGVEMSALEGALEDLRNGLASEIRVGDEVVPLDPELDDISLPMGPLVATGSPEDWWKIIQREYDEALTFEEPPELMPSPPYEGARTPFGILGSE